MTVAILASCEVGPQPPISTKRLVSESRTYADPAKQSRFKSALKDAVIHHEIYTGDDGREYVRWKGEDSAAVERIQVQLFGEPLPDGRHIHFGAPHHERFKKWLTDNGIPFKTRQSDGKEYIVWNAVDYPKISQWEYFPRDTFDKAQVLSSNPTVVPDARKSGARGSP
jgi:hypothetical protein